MSKTKNEEARQLAEKLRNEYMDGVASSASSHLRRLVAENEQLQSQLESIGAGRVGPLVASKADAQDWPTLDKPARVGGGTFGTGVSTQHVRVGTLTHEQMVREERNRRKAWDLIYGPIDASTAVTHTTKNSDIDHASELRRHSRKLGYPAGETPGVMLRAADEIDRLHAMLAAAPQMPAMEPQHSEQEQATCRHCNGSGIGYSSGTNHPCLCQYK